MTATCLWPNFFRLTIVKLCAFLNAVSQKVIDPDKLIKLQNDVVQCFVGFELIFPPSFFHIMTHLLVHLVKEIDILGLVFLHNMFSFKMFMGALKKCVRNRARPEESIASAYETEEVIDFCVDFFDDLKPIGVPESRYEGKLNEKGTLGKKIICLHWWFLIQESALCGSSTIILGGPVYRGTQEDFALRIPGKVWGMDYMWAHEYFQQRVVEGSNT